MTREDFHQQYLQNLNPQQLEAVQTVDGPVLLLAVPGSGKTTVLVRRLGYMVRVCGIEAGRILAVTYTRAAAAEMRQRYIDLFGSDAGVPDFRTINSLAQGIITEYSKIKGQTWPYKLIEKNEHKKLFQQIYKNVTKENYVSSSAISELQTTISYIKNSMLSSEEIKNIPNSIEGLDEIYKTYYNDLKSRGLMDFDDQLVFAHQILKTRPEILNLFQDRFVYLCVDEAQDTSRIQHDIIKLLAKKKENLFMVGDEDQSIYGFRAAYPEALLSFEKDHKNAKVLFMEHNYRSTQEIIGAANAFIAQNQFRHPKTIRPVLDAGQPVEIIRTDRRITQYSWLLEVVRRTEGETAILYRNNDSALPLIDAFEREGIPYACPISEDASPFFPNRIISDLQDIINFACDPSNTERFLRIYNKFTIPIHRDMAHKAAEDSIKTGQPVLDMLLSFPSLHPKTKEEIEDLQSALIALPKVPAEKALLCIWKSLRYSEYLENNHMDSGKLDILHRIAQREPDPMAFLRRLDELRQIVQSHVNPPDAKVILSTIHSSKGLEYDTLYLLDILDGILPQKTPDALKSPADLQAYEEDRRLFYVAMTRAKKALYLFDCPDRPSCFAEEIGRALPVPVYDREDLLTPLLQSDRIGKKYTHQTCGKGRIVAQCKDRSLVSFDPLNYRLWTLSEMLDQRAPVTQYTAPAAKTVPKPTAAPAASAASPVKRDLQPGDKVIHIAFGAGTIQSIDHGIADITFPPPHGMKKIMLQVSLDKGILQ